jgi:glycosyltransferase involved in cell wall biosynthesis
VRGLLERGHEVEAWCPPTADQTYLPLADLVTEHVVPLPGFDVYLGSREFRPLYRLRWHPWARLRSMDEHSRRCAQEMRASGFDLLFAASCMIYHTPPIARFVDGPSALYLQEPNRPLYEALPELPWPSAPWWRLPIIRAVARDERRSAKAFDQILVNSFFSRESILRAFGVDATVCYLGVDTDRFVAAHRPRERFAVSIGAVVPAKNVEFLIESIAQVAEPVRPALVLIANSVVEPYWHQVRELAARRQVTVTLERRISDAAMVDILNRAWVMVYAPRLEPFGYAPLEANACGVPVIAVAEGGVRETIEDGVNGILVEHDAGHMAAAIERIMTDDALQRQLSAGAEERARSKWSLGPSIDRLDERLRALRRAY